MVNVYIDPTFEDDERRERLFSGDIVIYTGVPEVAEFAAFARRLVGAALAPHEPLTAHTSRSPAELAELLIEFKPRFVNHPESFAHVCRITTALDATADTTIADLPRLRTAFPVDGLRTGIAYAFQPHRDTWYCAPSAQVNWWMPIWPVTERNGMEFYPRHFGRCLPNSSGDYDLRDADGWRSRIRDFSGAQDLRVHPAPQPPLDADETCLRLVPPLGGIMLFAGDQLHATVPNASGLTRYSVDFRTVSAVDVREGRGAPCLDVASRGSTMRDFRRLSPLAGVGGCDLPARERCDLAEITPLHPA